MEFEEQVKNINPYDAFKTCNRNKQILEPTLYEGKSETLKRCENEIELTKRYFTTAEISSFISKDSLQYISECLFTNSLIDYLRTPSVR